MNERRILDIVAIVYFWGAALVCMAMFFLEPDPVPLFLAGAFIFIERVLLNFKAEAGGNDAERE